jgi:hypothetical protein
MVAFFWSTAEYVGYDGAWGRSLNYGNDNVLRNYGKKSSAASVRCILD